MLLQQGTASVSSGLARLTAVGSGDGGGGGAGVHHSFTETGEGFHCASGFHFGSQQSKPTRMMAAASRNMVASGQQLTYPTYFTGEYGVQHQQYAATVTPDPSFFPQPTQGYIPNADLFRANLACYVGGGATTQSPSQPMYPFPSNQQLQQQIAYSNAGSGARFMGDQQQHSSFAQMFPHMQMLAPFMMNLPTKDTPSQFQSPSNTVFPKQKVATNGALVQPSRKRLVKARSSSSSTSSSEDDGGTSPTLARPVKKERIVTGTAGEDNSEMGLGGESRLKITFSNLGTPGNYPQVFGKSRLGVPDGLCGTYVLYSERWQSEILHETGSEFQGDDGTQHVLITWKISNLTSGITQLRTETPKEAILRHKDGRTLCNKVFRKALEQRATDLEGDLKHETNPIRIKTMKNLIKKLRPKHFSEGPLVFGLRHESVQTRFKSMTKLGPDGVLRLKDTPDALTS
jgi:hypothetical protein